MSAKPGQSQIQETETGDRLIGVVLAAAVPERLAQMNSLLSSEPDIDVYVSAETADEALGAMRSLPHRLGVVAVVTLGLGGDHDSFWLIRSIREIYPTLPVLACGTGIDDATISWALFTGADGFVALEVEPARFVDALRRIAQRELILEGLPPGWMARANDRRPPVIVLPEAADEIVPSSKDAGVREDEPLPEAGAEEGSSQEQEEMVVARGPGRQKRAPSGSRIGHLFGRRHRERDPPRGDKGSVVDPDEVD